jgi:hypothetical protein
MVLGCAFALARVAVSTRTEARGAAEGGIAEISKKDREQIVLLDRTMFCQTKS